MKKEKKVTDKQAEELFKIVKGFNTTLKDGTEKRFEAGKKGQFITEKDFSPSDWKALTGMGAVVSIDNVDDEEAVIIETE